MTRREHNVAAADKPRIGLFALLRRPSRSKGLVRAHFHRPVTDLLARPPAGLPGRVAGSDINGQVVFQNARGQRGVAQITRAP